MGLGKDLVNVRPRRPFHGWKLAASVLMAFVALSCQGDPGPPPDAGEAGARSPESQTGLSVVDSHARILSGMGTVYLTVVNYDAEGDRLLRVETPWATAAETHESVNENGVMRMLARPDGFEVPPRGRLALEPGAKHIMLVEPEVPQSETAKIPLTLYFQRHGTVEIEVPVRSPREPDPMPTMEHGAHSGTEE